MYFAACSTVNRRHASSAEPWDSPNLTLKRIFRSPMVGGVASLLPILGKLEAET